MKVIYGPVPSWRLGRSLGVDPLGGRVKQCTVDCTYCQLGPTRGATLQRGTWVQPADLAAELRAVSDLGAEYVTFAGMGESTIAENLVELMRVAREAQSTRLAITPLRSSPIAPLSPTDIGEAAKAFWGLSVRCVYEVPRPDVRPIEAASTARRRPEGGTPRGGATQRGVDTGDLHRGARS